MSELKNLIEETDELVWKNTLFLFCKENEKNNSFNIEQEEKEKFLQVCCTKYLYNNEFKNEEMKTLLYQCICFLLREKKGLNYIISDSKFLDILLIECFEKEKEEVFEELRCLINVLHQNDNLRLIFSNYLSKTKFKTILFLLKKNNANYLFFLSKILFYATYNSKSCNELFELDSSLFFEIFKKFNHFLDNLNQDILKLQFFELYLSETIKFLFNLFAHLKSSNLFFNETTSSIFKKILKLQSEYSTISNDPIIRVLQALMFSSDDFIKIFYFKNQVLDEQVLHFILQFFFNNINDESSFSIILNPIIIFLEKSIQNLKIRKVLQKWLIDRNTDKFEIKIPNEYFERIEKEKIESEKRIEELRKKRIEEEKHKGDQDEDDDDDEDEEDDDDTNEKFNPTEGLKTPLSVLISHMTHFNYQFKTSVCNFLFTLCDHDTQFYINLCGIGPAAGFLAEKGMLSSLMGGN
eukprot:gene2299-2472_t